MYVVVVCVLIATAVDHTDPVVLEYELSSNGHKDSSMQESLPSIMAISSLDLLLLLCALLIAIAACLARKEGFR